MVVGSSRENGRCAPSSGEPPVATYYVSVFITHFLNTPAQNYEILRKLYLDLNLSVREIVELTDSGWSKTSIVEAIKAYDLLKENPKKMIRLKYGYKIVKGQIKPIKKELEVIKLIKKLHNGGHSIRQIAIYLNNKKIKSKRGGNWDKSVVSAIVKREKGGSK
mgnify:CR=1 FL=1